MASLGPQNHHEVVVPIQNHVNGNDKYDHEEQHEKEEDDDSSNFDYSQRGQWLRAAILGAIDGLLSVASLMMGVGAVNEDVKAMLLAGFAGTMAGASSMAIGEFVSLSTLYDVEVSQMKRDMNRGDLHKVDAMRGMENTEKEGKKNKKKKLPYPFQAALASGFSFSVGALVPLLAAAYITDYKVRLMVIVAVASLALVVFGGLGSVVGRTPNVAGSCFRVLAGGWIAMAITFGLTKLMDSKGLQF